VYQIELEFAFVYDNDRFLLYHIDTEVAFVCHITLEDVFV